MDDATGDALAWLRDKVESLERGQHETQALMREYMSKQDQLCRFSQMQNEAVNREVKAVSVAVHGDGEKPGLKGELAKTSWQINLLWAGFGVVGTASLIAVVNAFWHIIPTAMLVAPK